MDTPNSSDSENLFENLPDGSLFTIAEDPHIWEKQGGKAVRASVPSEKAIQTRGHVIRENMARENSGIPLIPNTRLRREAVTVLNLQPEKMVDVRHIPGEKEIRQHFTALLQEPAHHLGLPGPLLLAFEREERLRAEKARRNDQSPILRNPSELAEHRTLDYERVPMGSFFVTTAKANPKSMVYLKLQGNACETVCTYEEWEAGLMSATVQRKPVKYSDIQRRGTGESIAPVTVISALTPNEADRLITEHHAIMAKEKRPVDAAQLAFDESVRAENRVFWQQAA